MTDLFFTVLKMDGYALIAALVVLIGFLLLRRTRVSKTALLLLWLIVGFRLVCPWSPPSPLSLFNWDAASRSAQNLSRLESAYVGDVQAAVEVPGGNESFDRAVAAGARPVLNDGIQMQVAYYYQDEAGNITPAKTFREAYGGIAAAVWLAGAALFVLYGAVSYLALKRRLRFAVRDGAPDGVWLSDRIPSPCVAGLVRPRIYLTFGMGEGEREYVLAHERQHIKNGDHIWKVLGWLVMCVHWFNPLLWAVYRAFLWTLEEACDQRVLRELGEERRADYGQALLSLSSEKRFRPGFSPLAFGEGDTKDRVKTVLKYKKPLAWLTAVALVLGTAVGVCVLTSRAEREGDAATDGIEDIYGTYQIDGVIHLTSASSVTSDYLLKTAQEQKIIVNAQLFSGYGVEVVNPRYEPMEVGDTLATIETEDEQTQRRSTLGLTRYRSVRGWKVLRHDGTQTGKHIFALDGKLWLGDWRYQDHAAKPYGEYWVIFSAERAQPAGQEDGAQGLAAPELTPAGDTVYWEYRPDEAFGSPGFPFLFLFHSECKKFELACESGELLLCSHGYSGTKIRGRGNALTVADSSEQVYWSPVPEGGGEPLTSDEIAVKVWRDSELVFTARISIELAGRTETGYSYRARAALSDTEHFFFEKEDGDSDQVYAQLIGGPDYYPGFTFTARVEAVESDPDPNADAYQMLLTVRPEQNLADGVSTYRFSWTSWEYAYHAGDRVLITARNPSAVTDVATGETLGCFGQVNWVASLANIAAEWRVDLTHDGTDERVYVADDHGKEAGAFYLVVESAAKNSGPEVLWYGEASISHVGQNGFYLYRDPQDGKDYILNWVSYMGMGFANYRYRLFSLSPQGEEQVAREGLLSFDLYDLWSGDPEQMREFDAGINALLDESVVLLSTNGDTPEGVYYGDPDEPVRPVGPFVSEAEFFEKNQALAQGEYTFLGEITSKQDDCIVLVATTLWNDGRDWQYQFVIPATALADGAENYQEGDTVSVTADGPLYRNAFPDEGTKVEVRLVYADPVPETPPAQQSPPAVSPAAS